MIDRRYFLLVISICLCALPLQAEPTTKVFLNGTLTPVYFNDGDTFKILGGPLAGASARMAGFNTLESYGPVHQWGEWHAKELYINAKMATLNARRGVWRCSSDMSKDTYGRILAQCPDLALDQIKKGFAHAMSVTEEPADPEYVLAQQEAIKNRRGFWAHGTPEYILTSPHSVEEAGSKEPYDRFVSTIDGHSEKSIHTNAYQQCQKICYLPPGLVKDQKSKSNLTNPVASCMTYVDYNFRYGQQRAECLK